MRPKSNSRRRARFKAFVDGYAANFRENYYWRPDALFPFAGALPSNHSPDGCCAQVAWIKSDSKAILAIHTNLIAHNHRLTVTHNGHNTWKLNVFNVQKNDTGSYMCQINTQPMILQVSVVPARIVFSVEGGGGGNTPTASPADFVAVFPVGFARARSAIGELAGWTSNVRRDK